MRTRWIRSLVVASIFALIVVGISAVGAAGPNANGGGGAAQSRAVSPLVATTVGAGWQFFSFSGVGADASGSPFTYTSAGFTKVTITDAFCKGDRFTLLDGTTNLGNTSNVPAAASCPSPSGNPGDTSNPDTALADPAYSHGVFVLGSGSHSLTIRAFRAPFGIGGAYYRIDADVVSIATSGGSGQSAITTTAFANKLKATVTDSGGNPVPGVTVTFTAPASGASGTFGAPGPNCTVAPGGLTAACTTNASGVATSPTFTANKIPGSYDVIASASGVVGTAPFHLTNTLGTPQFVVKVTNVNPTSVKPGVNFTYTFTIKNTGTADSINTTATYPLPDTVTFGSASGDHNFACGAVGPPNATTMKCTDGRIAIGETATITLVVFTPQNAPPGEIIGTNTLTVVGTADGQGTGDGGTGTGSGTSAQTVTIQDPGWSAPPA